MMSAVLAMAFIPAAVGFAGLARPATRLGRPGTRSAFMQIRPRNMRDGGEDAGDGALSRLRKDARDISVAPFSLDDAEFSREEQEAFEREAAEAFKAGFSFMQVRPRPLRSSFAKLWRLPMSMPDDMGITSNWKR